jgi:hypothetical protein
MKICERIEKLKKFPEIGQTYKLHLSVEVSGIKSPCYARIRELNGRYALVDFHEKTEDMFSYSTRILNLDYVVTVEAA